MLKSMCRLRWVLRRGPAGLKPTPDLYSVRSDAVPGIGVDLSSLHMGDVWTPTGYAAPVVDGFQAGQACRHFTTTEGHRPSLLGRKQGGHGTGQGCAFKPA